MGSTCILYVYVYFSHQNLRYTGDTPGADTDGTVCCGPNIRVRNLDASEKKLEDHASFTLLLHGVDAIG